MQSQSKQEIIDNDLNNIYLKTYQDCDFSNAKILITGCAGFLGFYITKYFAANHERLGIKKIIALDSFILGECPDWLNELKNNYSEILKVEKFILGKNDINELDDYKSVTHILHMASIASPTFYRKFPLETIDANIWGLRNLLDKYKSSDFLKGFLFFSSSEIYGDPDKNNIPTSENYRGLVSCTGPRACYDESKRFGETLSTIYRDQYSIPISIVRPFNNYGPGMKIEDKRLPADLAKCILLNKDIYIFSDGKPTRSFCYVSDAIIGYLKVLCSKYHTEFNIGIDKEETSVIKMAEIYREIGKSEFGYSGQIFRKVNEDPNYLSDNPNRRQPDISKAKKLLDFNPEVLVNEGVKNYLYFLFG